MATKTNFCSITVLLEVLELIEPDSALLQCRHHLRKLPSFSRRGTNSPKMPASHSKLPLETGLNVPRKDNTINNRKGLSFLVSLNLNISFEESTNLTRQGLFMRPEKAQPGSTFSSLLHIWSGARRFQSRVYVFTLFGFTILRLYCITRYLTWQYCTTMQGGKNLLCLPCLAVSQLGTKDS